MVTDPLPDHPHCQRQNLKWAIFRPGSGPASAPNSHPFGAPAITRFIAKRRFAVSVALAYLAESDKRKPPFKSDNPDRYDVCLAKQFPQKGTSSEVS